MKTLVYKVIFRLDEGEPNEKTYNEGFVIVYINEKNEFIKMEGLLTNDYLIAEVVEHDLVITIYSSYNIFCLCSIALLEELPQNAEKELDIYWEGTVDIDDVCFPLELEFENQYPVAVMHDEYEDGEEEDEDDVFCTDQVQEYGDNLEYVTETAQIITTERINKNDDINKCFQMLSEFKKTNVLIGEEWS